MRANKLFRILGVALVSLALVTCKKYEDTVGPRYYSAPKDFKIIDNKFNLEKSTLEVDSVNFRQTGVHNFYGKFSSRVDWTVKIKGLRSGAFKTIKGSSMQLDSTNCAWRGGHSGLYFFKKNETCIAELSILGSSVILLDTFTIKTPFDFNRPQDGILLIRGRTPASYPAYKVLHGADFEGDFEFFESGMVSEFPEQFGFIEGQDVDGFDPKNTVNKLHSIGSLGSVEGERCYFLYATPNNLGKAQCDPAPYFGGAMQFRYYGGSLNGKAYDFFTDINNPDDMWINVYLYGNDTTMSSQFSFELHEADSTNEKNKGTSFRRTNLKYNFKGDINDPIYCKARICEGSDRMVAPDFSGYTLTNRHDPPSDDAYNHNFVPDTKGWKLYSYKISKNDKSTVANNGNAGNGKIESNRIARIQFGIISKGNPKTPTGAIFDYATITFGGPFNPDKY